ncbi:MAG: SRPBCC domain-containing protein [Kangiellaceae bacterium]|nr:SRPBCC domain-containing protein [Kangiellaceae bacterium]MCW9015716.1 SRPBCC domain-containing protein [Kangiellaceae bacterium]
MKSICLKIGVSAPVDKVMSAVNSLEGLANWWTDDVSGSTKEGKTIAFRFNGEGPEVRVVKDEKTQVSWLLTSGPEEWLGTRINFQAIEEDNENVLYFQHSGWQEESSFFHHCSMKWAVFMLSLKEYIDSGKGRAFPNDIKITSVGF